MLTSLIIKVDPDTLASLSTGAASINTWNAFNKYEQHVKTLRMLLELLMLDIFIYMQIKMPHIV